MSIPEKPNSRKEAYLNRIATGEGDIPAEPDGRIESYLDGIIKNNYTKKELNAKFENKADLNESKKVPESQLPSYVDDVIEFDSLSDFPAEGEKGKIYVAVDSNKTYRWSGTVYINIPQSITLGTAPGQPATENGTNGTAETAAKSDHTHPFQSYTDLKNKPFNAISENGGLSVENNKLVLTDKQAYDEAVSRSIENQGTVGYSAKNLLDSAPEAAVSSAYDDIGFTVNSDGSITIPPRAASVKPCMIKLERSPVPISEFPEKIIMSLTGGKGLIKLDINYARRSDGSGVVGGEEVYNGDKIVNLSGVQDKYAIFYLYLDPDTPITEELTLHFMIRDARITDDTYVPYQGGSIDDRFNAKTDFKVFEFDSTATILSAAQEIYSQIQNPSMINAHIIINGRVYYAIFSKTSNNHGTVMIWSYIGSMNGGIYFYIIAGGIWTLRTINTEGGTS